MPKISKTKTGSEFRVRTKEGKISGEFDKKKSAKERKQQLKALERGRKK